MKSDNEILGEYVRKTRPEIARSFDFLVSLMVEKATDGMRRLADVLKNPKTKKMLEKMKEMEREDAK